MILDSLLEPCPTTAQRREAETPPGNWATEIGDVPLEFDAGNDCCDGGRGRPTPPSVSTRSTVSPSDDWTIGAVKPPTAPTLRAPSAGAFHVGDDKPDRLGRFVDEDLLTNDDHISILNAPPQEVDRFAITVRRPGHTGTASSTSRYRLDPAAHEGVRRSRGRSPRPDLHRTLDAATGPRQSDYSPRRQCRWDRNRSQPLRQRESGTSEKVPTCHAQICEP